MNRADFMDQLESLLQSIAPTEREEAIQYYNDYFDDAGKENEQDVIEALGNPARVAENIKRDLLGNGYGEKPMRKAQASDRALMEYGKEEQDSDGDTDQDSGNPATGDGQGSAATGHSQGSGSASAGYGQGSGSTAAGYGQGSGSTAAGYGQGGGSAAGYGQGSGSAAAGYGQGSGNAAAGNGQGGGSAAGYGQGSGSAKKESDRQAWGSYKGYESGSQDFAAGEDRYQWSHDTAGWSQDVPEKSQKGRLPVWAIALLVTVLVLVSPALLGIIAGVLGLLVGALAGWFGLIFGAGVAAVCLLLAFLVLVATGIICCFISPWVGMAMVGGGLICGCIGLLFLMVTVAMAGIATPAIFRGIVWIFRAVSGRRRRTANA